MYEAVRQLNDCRTALLFELHFEGLLHYEANNYDLEIL